MSMLQTFLIDLSRIGIGASFLFLSCLDIKYRPVIFDLMRKRNLPQHWILYIGALIWKISTSIAIVLNFHTCWAAMLLLIYILIANAIFNNFWTLSGDEQGFSLGLFVTHIAICFSLLLLVAACA